jgi:arylsulfatase A-like enzyme
VTRESARLTLRFRAGAARIALGAAVSVVALACGGCQRAAPGSDPPLIRLVDRLPEARVSTPLDEIDGAGSIEALEGRVRRRVLMRTDFEDARAQRVTKSCALVPGGSAPPGGHAMRCRDGGALELAIATGRAVRLRAALRLAGPRCRSADATLLEHGARSPLLLHRFARLAPGPSWSTHQTEIFLTPETQRLYLRFRSPDCEAWVDDLLLEELDLTRSQELALIKGRTVLQDGASRRGRVRRGRLLPVPDPSSAAPPRDDAYTVRDAIFAPAPTTLDFPLRVPRDAWLHGAYGLAQESQPGDAVEFRVVLRTSGGERELLRETLRVTTPERWHWHPLDVDLSRDAGRDARLIFTTRASEGRGYGLWGAPMVARARAPGDPPSLILIGVDTLRADRISPYGGRAGTSPHIAELARDGVRFEQVISASNWTGPAFHSLFTGLAASEARRRVPIGHVTLAERLREAGYLTQAFAYKPSLYDKGFDQGFDGFFNVSRSHVRAPHNVAKALAWLERHHRERFFLFLHMNDPHQPFTQPMEHLDADLRERLEAFGIALPIQVRSEAIPGCRGCSADGAVVPEARALARGLYDDAIRYLDRHLGVLLAALRDMGIYEDAVVAFVSDHGESLWQHDGLYSHAGPGLYDELVRVPLILKPARLPASLRGRVVKSQVRLSDLAPTLLELAGVPLAEGEMDAQSLVPLLEEGSPRSDRVALFRGEGSIGVRADGWKYAREVAAGGTVVERLYDLHSDPGETRDLSQVAPGDLARMRQLLAAQLLRSRALHSLVVAGAGVPGPVSMRIRALSAGAARVEHGHPPLRVVEGGPGVVLAYEGRLEGPILALAQFEPSADARYEIDLVAGDQTLRRTLHARQAKPFDAERSLATAGEEPFAVGLVGPRSPRAPDGGAPEVLDARNLEALRALGYLRDE